MTALSAARLSLLTGILVLGLKWLAYAWTGSIALYSDALESFINVAAALGALIAIQISQQPADDNHPYGHAKAEYFSAVFEGVLIVLAAIAIIHEAWQRVFAPIALTAIGAGAFMSLLATAINAGLAGYLIRLSQKNYSVALKADGLHILSDVVTSIGVLIGVGLAWLTGKWMLDPLLAIVVAGSILWQGSKLVRESVGGLMDEGLTAEKLAELHQIIAIQMQGAIQVHAIKTRHAGVLTFVEFHLVVPANMTVKEAHDICDRIEIALTKEVPTAKITIHIEPESEKEQGGFIL